MNSESYLNFAMEDLERVSSVEESREYLRALFEDFTKGLSFLHFNLPEFILVILPGLKDYRTNYLQMLRYPELFVNNLLLSNVNEDTQISFRVNNQSYIVTIAGISVLADAVRFLDKSKKSEGLVQKAKENLARMWLSKRHILIYDTNLILH